ncbi:GIY-YIG nuclease family protein [Nonomuraea gerenzanensis]|uniref:GIY-YIG domain-containing protein n=1 Tax=Nonomuraea gerenzanensis TaxID=93944 RepID=A0A1M4EDS5_9ACTN|nr:hypothetical protein [Nonomuraea gerenzanensis]UBU08570.1 hypothetical protein LCN96_29720 [Nonomuraea gerenzanensis]SBO96924.1 hypothetical protein BN4615_P6440 [Nonomuraea gerenzanensis]
MNEWGEAGLAVLRAAAAHAPREAGVYLFLGERGFLGERDEVLYVGKAADLRRRPRRHAAVRAPASRLHQRYDLVRRVGWEIAADEVAAA